MQQKKPEERIVAEIPRDLKRRATAKAALQGKTLKDALIELLSNYVEGFADEEETEEDPAQFAPITA